MNKRFTLAAAVSLAAWLAASPALAGPLDKTECIAPAKPGGGFDLTCKLAQGALLDGKYIADPMRISYMPGGIGAVAYNAIVAQRPAEANTLVAFSGGSLLNLAQASSAATPSTTCAGSPAWAPITAQWSSPRVRPSRPWPTWWLR